MIFYTSQRELTRNRKRFISSANQEGVSLVELMVAVAIGLLATVVIFTVYQNADGYKRSTVGAGDAQSNGAVALFTLERYIRTAGSALTTTSEVQLGTFSEAPRANLVLGCPLAGFPSASVVTGVTTATTTPVAPVRIVDGSLRPGGAVGSSDIIVIMGGNADITTNPTRAGLVAAGATTVPAVQNTFGWRLANGARPADIALVTINLTVGTTTVSTVPCAARRLAAISSASGTGAFTLAAATPATIYGPTTNIHNLGPSPYLLSISVNAQQELVETDFTLVATGESLIPTTRIIADGIVNMQAQYGIDNDQDDNVDQWVEPTGVWANPVAVDLPCMGPVPPAVAPSCTTVTAALNKIKAIRIAVLARSAHYASPNKQTGACESTPLRGTWPLLPAVAAMTGTAPVTNAPAQPVGADILPQVIASAPANVANANWQCFKYRTFENVVPVLNMIRSPL